MARFLEHNAKHLLDEAGLPVPVSIVASTAHEAFLAAESLGGHCVVKALVPGNRRGRAGAVRLCDDPQAAEAATQELLGLNVGLYRVNAVLVEAWQDIERELYVAFEIAAGRPAYTLLASALGGVDIEQHAASVVVEDIDPNRLPDAGWYAEVWQRTGVMDQIAELGNLTATLAMLFVEHDLTLLEINPLAILADGSLSCVGALMAIDDNALARQPALRERVVEGSDRAVRPETALEARVTAMNQDVSQRGSARYLELEGGNIGFLCGGGGASLLLFDAIVAAGGQPANYSEFGGNPTEQRVYDLTRVVLDKPGVRGLFLAHNLTNNTQVDVVAAGVIRALRDAGPEQPFPVVAREAGLHDTEAGTMFAAAGIEWFGEDTPLDRAALTMVERMRRAGY